MGKDWFYNRPERISKYLELKNNNMLPDYLVEDFEIFYHYVNLGQDLQFKAEIDNVKASINVAEQEGDITSELAWYIRREIL